MVGVMLIGRAHTLMLAQTPPDETLSLMPLFKPSARVLWLISSHW